MVVEDNPDTVLFLKDRLEYLGYRVTSACNGNEALSQIAQEKPDLIVLDIMMPYMDGWEVCDHLKSSPETTRIPILMLTARGEISDKVKGLTIGADDYLSKPYDITELVARVQALLRRSDPPYSNYSDESTFGISLRPGNYMSIQISGIRALNTVTKAILAIDVEAYIRQGDNTPYIDWRFNSKQWGKQLFRTVFSNNPEVLANYHHVLGDVKVDEKLHIRIESARDLLGLPFEFLFENIDDDGEYMILKHPLSRLISGIPIRGMPLTPGFLNNLWTRGEKLRILLIGSNTPPSIPGVDREIQALSSSLQDLFANKRIEASVKTLSTQEATYNNVLRELSNCKYHIVHYAGHSFYNKQSPEKSYLPFWEDKNFQGRVLRMAVSELSMRLRNSDLRFIYLSCCQGTKTGEPGDLLNDDFLGMAHGIISSGVPSVLGFRWPVSDDRARSLAITFYQSLAKYGVVDTALFEARCQLAAQNRDDITWLSPILIMQA
jgi:CheY-like chemotaxis protein